MSDVDFHEYATACDHCDWVNVISPMRAGDQLHCARCGHTIITLHPNAASQLLSNGCSAALMFIMSLCFVFLGFSSSGTSQQITLLDCIYSLMGEHYISLGIIVTLTLLVLPIVYLTAVILIALAMRKGRIRRSYYGLLHTLSALQPWLMVDVFLLGGLVALVKLHSLADIQLGLSFWAFCAFTILLVRTASFVDKRWIWYRLCGPAPEVAVRQASALSQGLKGCQYCGALVPEQKHKCQRCHHVLHHRKKGSLGNTLALLMAACALYVPANLFPIMITTFLGRSEPSTIMGGVILLWGLKSYLVAMVILVASILVPVAKILALFWLCWQTRFHSAGLLQQKQTQRIYQMTEFVGRWSMVDVFVVAILSALVQLGAVMNIIPGVAAISFAAVVILTMLAAMSFDSRLLWDKSEEITI
ncbi:PqiA/YebS family transporter subunit [Vibrio mangrovi]|uniref:Paraquat-inducible protein A n=1 Tax=Vibrio mangrovi TaxID=474394 RepID=A0A1Y6IN01_9VIBR|nr:PqiA/YebS family transporter subunit [Vibrio mangrovi]MDW6004154.1 PqiA/YebS family transporter subunit [Vibrio mangrovi]SMR99049.1 Paraquat-inducible protein A [Vibrio mangrovi]